MPTVYVFKMRDARLRALCRNSRGVGIPTDQYHDGAPMTWEFVREMPEEYLSEFTTKAEALQQLDGQSYCFISPNEMTQRFQ